VNFCEIFLIFREKNQYRETAASALISLKKSCQVPKLPIV
jgi:hypothetical protein